MIIYDKATIKFDQKWNFICKLWNIIVNSRNLLDKNYEKSLLLSDRLIKNQIKLMLYQILSSIFDPNFINNLIIYLKQLKSAFDSIKVPQSRSTQ